MIPMLHMKWSRTCCLTHSRVKEQKPKSLLLVVVSAGGQTKTSAEKQVELKILDEHQAPSPKDVDLSPVPVMEFGSFVVNNHKNSNVDFKAMDQV